MSELIEMKCMTILIELLLYKRGNMSYDRQTLTSLLMLRTEVLVVDASIGLEESIARCNLIRQKISDGCEIWSDDERKTIDQMIKQFNSFMKS